MNFASPVSVILLSLLCMLSPVLSDEDEEHWLEEFIDEEPLFNDAGLRSRRYRAPTPASMEEARVLDTRDLLELLQQRPEAALVNVLPLTQFGDEYVLKKSYFHIEGSVWLPNVGRGVIGADLEQWFFNCLENLTDSNKAHPIVIYCQADCWMSWNAIKRASKKGYSELYWYRNGMDGWREHELPVVDAIPESRNDFKNHPEARS